MNLKHAAALSLPAALGLALILVGLAPQFGPSAGQAEDVVPTDPPSISTARAESARRVPAIAHPGLFWAPVGSRFTFALRTSTELNATSRDPEHGDHTETQRLSTGGRMIVEVIARDEHDAVVAFACPDLQPDLPVGAEIASELLANFDAVRARNLARVDMDGRIRGYRFADGLGMPQRDYVRGLFGGFGFVVPSDAGDRWQASGDDSTGTFEARYACTGADAATIAVVRTKQRYTAQRNAAEMPADVEGDAHATIDRAEFGWLVRAAVDETTRIDATLAPVAFCVRYRATIELEAHANDAIAVADAFEGEWAAAGGHAEDPTEMFDARDRAEWKARLAGKSVASLAAAMSELLAADQGDSRELFDLWSDARRLLKLDPAAIELVERLLTTPDIDPRLASLWLSALADAGSEPAQTALVAAWNDPTHSADVRGAAAAAMFDLRAPSAELVGSVSHHVDRLEAIDAVDATALLALGAMAQRDPTVAVGDRSVLAVVEDWRDRARRIDAEDLWLDALANARSPKLEAAARDALLDERDVIRSAAVRALGQVAGDDACATLCRLSREDVSPEVRKAVLAQLATRAESGSRDAILLAAESDSDESVRQAALMALARKGVQATDRTRLAAIARDDSSEAVRGAAERLLQDA